MDDKLIESIYDILHMKLIKLVDTKNSVDRICGEAWTRIDNSGLIHLVREKWRTE